MIKNIILIGAGGFSKSCIYILNKKRIKYFIDSEKTGSWLGIPIIGPTIESIPNYKKYKYFISIGEPQARKFFFDALKSKNLKIVSCISKKSFVSKKKRKILKNKGIFVGDGVYISDFSYIEDNVVINTGSIVEHGSKIGKHSNLSTGTIINGDVIVKELVFLGSGCIVRNAIVIETNCFVGCGSNVIKSTHANKIYIGSPAKEMNK